MRRRLLAAAACAILLPLAAGCNGMLGEGRRETIPESSLPNSGLAVFRQSHPSAQIERIEATYSNAPPFYRILYHEDGLKEAEAEFLYRDYEQFSNMLADKVRAAFRTAHPWGVIENVEWFEDVAKHAQYYRVTFHPAPALEAFYDPDGQPTAPAGSKKGDGTSRPAVAPTTSASDDPDAGRPAWVKAYRLPRMVIVTDEAGRPITGASVHVVSASIDYYPAQDTGQDGSVILRKQIYVDAPRWIDVQHDGYEMSQVDYPQQWPLEVKLHKSRSN